MFNKQVTIIGAGPSGLCLAVLLQQANIQVKVFERDSLTLGRDQGGTLDMQSDYGQVAIKAAGLFEEFMKVARCEGDNTKIVDSNTAKILFQDEPVPSQPAQQFDENGVAIEVFSKPEIDRMELRNLFLKPLKAGTVEWNKAVDCVKKIDSTGQYQVNFKDGTNHVTDLLVGCDGAWSKVRACFTETKPTYSGVYFIESKLTLDGKDEVTKSVIERTGEGSLISFYNNKGILAQRNSNHIRMYYCFRMEKEKIEETFQFEKVVIECKDEFSFIKRPLYSLPPEWDWKTQPGVTIIGDSAHVMTPFAGLGANIALLDAHDLAQFLIHGRDGKSNEEVLNEKDIDWNQVIAGFESKMFARSKDAAQLTQSYLDYCLCEGNPDQFIQVMLSHGREEEKTE